MKDDLTVRIKRRDGTVQEVTVAEAILVYEKRRDAAKNEEERAHCEKRIEQLRARWKRATKKVSRVERSTSDGKRGAPKPARVSDPDAPTNLREKPTR